MSFLALIPIHQQNERIIQNLSFYYINLKILQFLKLITNL